MRSCILPQSYDEVVHAPRQVCHFSAAFNLKLDGIVSLRGMIYSFQYFDQAYVASTTAGQSVGDPQGSLMFYGVWLYQQAFTYFHMGYASALAWVLFVVTMLCTALLLWTSKRWVHYGGGLS